VARYTPGTREVPRHIATKLSDTAHMATAVLAIINAIIALSIPIMVTSIPPPLYTYRSGLLHSRLFSSFVIACGMANYWCYLDQARILRDGFNEAGCCGLLLWEP
jgi:hypothetical protein